MLNDSLFVYSTNGKVIFALPSAPTASQNNKIQGTFLKKDDPKITALMQQAELLSSLALKVNAENTDQSLENAWKVRLTLYLLEFSNINHHSSLASNVYKWLTSMGFNPMFRDCNINHFYNPLFQTCLENTHNNLQSWFSVLRLPSLWSAYDQESWTQAVTLHLLVLHEAMWHFYAQGSE